MQPGRRDPDERVALAHAFGAEHLVARDGSDQEPGEIVRARGVHPGHLGGLAAEQRRAAARASIGHPADDAREHRRIDLGGREVVEEEERFGPHRKCVVHAVVHQVRADDLVPIE